MGEKKVTPWHVYLAPAVIALCLMAGCDHNGIAVNGKDSTPEKIIIHTNEYHAERLHVRYPQIEGMKSEFAQTKINVVLAKQAAEFFEQQKNVAAEAAVNPDRHGDFRGKMSYEIKWKTVEVLSLVCTTAVYDGKQGCCYEQHGYTFNLKTGEQIPLRDIVAEGDERREAWKEKILQELRAYNIPTAKYFPGVEDKTSYYLLNESTIVLVFPQAGIEPGRTVVWALELPY